MIVLSESKNVHLFVDVWMINFIFIGPTFTYSFGFLAFVYLSENEVKQPRFDVAEVLADKKGGYKIFYHENAFDAEEFCEIF